MNTCPGIHLKAITAAAAILTSAGLLCAQSQPSLPTFEVASIKPSGPGENPLGRGIFTFPGGRVSANKCTLAKLIQDAFDIQSYQLSGGPHWMNSDRYDIVATAPGSSLSSKANPADPKLPLTAEQRQMLQALLVDRFRLRYRKETREGSVYVLVKGSNDLKLQEAKNKTASPWAGGLRGGAITGDGLEGRNESMADLAKRLEPFLGRPVLDRTGLKGSYDFKYAYSSDEPRPDLMSAILESIQGIGLKFEPAKGPVETLVIERAEKPTEN